MIIAGNWKMHKTIAEGVSFIETLLPLVKDAKNQIFIAPAFTAISACAQAAKNSNVIIGAQNMSDADEGAFTGEVSAKMLKEAGAQFVILGHSERRSHFQETDTHINHKIKKALSECLQPILCIGESAKDRESGRSLEVIKKQLDDSLSGIADFANLVIAYEPVWAIGTGTVATLEIAQETHAAIRAHIGVKNIPLLYGGSVKPSNCETLIKQPDIDGALIGGASLDPNGFAQMVLT